jgi:putative peptidoglycan lipid II flippase
MPTEVGREEPPSSARSAQKVAAGILLSRIAGLVRESATAHYLGTSLYADTFRAALRMPNVLQNLLGEGTLSASFIPVYSELLSQGRREEAGRVAGAIFALLLVVAGVLALVGIALAPVLVSIFLPGFEGERRALSISAARIIFPMASTLVLSAWALGILNSHRRFFIPYVAPVLWNGAIIAALVGFGGRLGGASLVIALAWGALVGGLLQFAIQIPWVLRLDPNLSVRLNLRLEGVRTALRNAGPAILGRGVVQVSGWVDLVLASLLSFGAVAALGYAQTLYMLPISLFGMAVAAAELPEMARERMADPEVLRTRLSLGLRQIAVLVAPAVVGYILLGDVVVAAIYQTGDFGFADTVLVYIVLFGYTIGLFASTATRLFNSAFFALHDTRTPAKVAALRVSIAGIGGYLLMTPLEQVIVHGHRIGVAGIAFATGVAAWIEWGVLRRRLRERIGKPGAGASPLIKMFGAALLAAAAARGLDFLIPPLHRLLRAALVLGLYGGAYFTLARLFGLEEGRRVLDRFARMFRGRR